jgi:hypothetical protein
MPSYPVKSRAAQPRSEFNAPWGRLLKGVSLGATAAMLGAIVLVWITVPASTPGARFLTSASMLFILLGCALFTVRGYRIEGRSLLIQRWLWWTRLSLEGLREVTVDPEAMRKSFRTCGNGGLFSFAGWYRSKHLGSFRAYVTDLNRTVVLTFPRHKIVLSPDRPEAFVERLIRDRRLDT